MSQARAAGASAIRDALLAGAATLFFLLCAAPRLGTPGLDCNETAEAAEAVAFLATRASSGRPARPIPRLDAETWAFGRIPWMHEYHIGEVKTYCMAAAFALFGIGPVVLRAVTLAFGATAVFFSTLLAARLYGRVWAAGLGAWLATDPFLVVMARHDFGPCIVSVGLKIAGIYFLYSGGRSGGRVRLFLGGLLLGLCVWDKAISAWDLFGLGAASLLCLSARRWRDPRLWAPAAAGLAVGISPLVLFNIVYPLRTFTFPPYWRLNRESTVLGDMALRGRDIAGYLYRGFFEGVSAPEVVAGPGLDQAGGILTRRALPLAGAALAALLAPGRIGARARAESAFWLTASAGVFLAACLTPAMVSESHMGTLYPLLQLALLAALFGAMAEMGRPRWAAAAMTGCFAIAVVGNLFLVRQFYALLARRGGDGPWYTGMGDLARLCKAHDGPIVALDYTLSGPLTVYLGERKALTPGPEEPYSVWSGLLDTKRLPLATLAPGTWVVVYDLKIPEYPNAAPHADAARRDPRVVPVVTLPYADGRPWAGIYAVR